MNKIYLIIVGLLIPFAIQAATPAQTPAAAASVSDVLTGKWQYSKHADDYTGENYTDAVLGAENTITVGNILNAPDLMSLGNYVRSCELHLMQTSKGLTGRIRVSQGPVESQRHQLYAGFFLDGVEYGDKTGKQSFDGDHIDFNVPPDFARALAIGHKLNVKFMLFGAGEVVFHFDVTGLDLTQAGWANFSIFQQTAIAQGQALNTARFLAAVEADKLNRAAILRREKTEQANQQAAIEAQKFNELNHKAQIDMSTCAAPVYPRNSLRNAEYGTVRLKFLVGVNGQVINTTIINSTGFRALDQSAIDALSQCNFKPAIRNGVPFQDFAETNYVFRLPD